MATVFYQHDANPNALKGKTIAIMGYGSQGHAQAQNLRDSGYTSLLGWTRSRVGEEGQGGWIFGLPPAEAAKRACWIQILTPDETQGDLYESAIKPAPDQRERFSAFRTVSAFISKQLSRPKTSTS